MAELLKPTVEAEDVADLLAACLPLLRADMPRLDSSRQQVGERRVGGQGTTHGGVQKIRFRKSACEDLECGTGEAIFCERVPWRFCVKDMYALNGRKDFSEGSEVFLNLSSLPRTEGVNKDRFVLCAQPSSAVVWVQSKVQQSNAKPYSLSAVQIV